MPTTSPRLGAVGIGVTDLRRSSDFYADVLGLQFMTKIKLPTMDEVILTLGSGSALVLMQHSDGVDRDLATTGGKLVFYVADPVATVEVARRRGADVVREPTPVPEFGDAVIGFITDPDGHLIEILQA